MRGSSSSASIRPTNMNDLPWMPKESIDFLQKFLDMKPNAEVFEWGGGGSTVFFQKRCKHVTTIESDEKWFNRLKSSLGHLPNVTLIFCPSDRTDGVDIYDEDACVSNSDLFNHHVFVSYASKILQHKDDSLDLVLVDGRARIGCAKKAIPKVSKGGIIMIDDTYRSYYAPAIKRLDGLGWKKTILRGSRTTVWMRLS